MTHTSHTRNPLARRCPPATRARSRQMVAIPLLLGALLTACADDVPMDVEVDAGPEGGSGGLMPMGDGDGGGDGGGRPELLDDGGGGQPIEDGGAPIEEMEKGTPSALSPYTEEELATMTEAELHALYFADSDWDCCWTAECDAFCKRWDNGQLPVTNGTDMGCAPDIGMCATRPADDEIDAGAT